MSTKSAPVDLPVPSPINSVGPAALAVGFGDDVRTLFGDISKKTPRDDVAERAFIASKLHIARTQPTLDLGEREVAGASLGLGDMAAYDDSVAKSGPVPGGVGYGMFYNPAFKKNWSTGTAIYYDIISPTPPGGNVNTFLYLTATNRSGTNFSSYKPR